MVSEFHNQRKKPKNDLSNINQKENENKYLDTDQPKTRMRSWSKKMQRSRPLKNNEIKAIVV